MSTLTPAHSGLYAVEKLNQTNFLTWQFRQAYILRDRGLWKCIEPPPPSAKSTPPTEKEEQSALTQIVLNVSDEVIPLLHTVKTAKEAWTAICNQYQQKGLSTRVHLRRKLITTTYNSQGDSMSDHLNKIRELANQLRSLGCEVSDEELAIITLSSLPTQFEAFIVQMESRPIQEITFDFISGRLLAEDSRQRERQEDGSTTTPVALVGKAAGKPIAINRRHRRTTVTCIYCNRPGHTVEKCWDKEDDEKEGKSNHVANLSTFPDSD
jgi:gag-polypeptide of LTR copia-type